jgi:ACR3 family arsenite efflux pump ArsB
MKKLSLLGLFIIVMVFVSQLEKFQNAISSIMLNGIPPTFYLAMVLSLLIIIFLWHSLKYIQKIKRAQ